MQLPDLGETVFVRPDPRFCAPGATFSTVLRAPGLWLPVGGASVPWTGFLGERLRAGEIDIVPPSVTALPEAASPPAPPPPGNP